MATTRQRRAGMNPPVHRADAEEDRIYTEEDYAIPEAAQSADEWEADAYAGSWTGDQYLPDEAFAPDQEEYPEEDEWSEELPPEELFAPPKGLLMVGQQQHDDIQITGFRLVVPIPVKQGSAQLDKAV